MNKLTIVISAVLLLGSSAAIAQPYDYYNQYGEHNVCGRNLANTVNYIIDPATGMAVTQAQYQARYPWTNTSTWTFDCATSLWTDHTAVQNPGSYPPPQNYGQDRERDRGRDRDRDRDRDR